jgi:hypothetical protein
MLDDSKAILEYAEEVSLQVKDCIVNGASNAKLIDIAGTMGRIVSRAYAIQSRLEKEQQSQVDEYMDDLKKRYDEHDCDGACPLCEEYYYARGWDGLAHYANSKGLKKK